MFLKLGDHPDLLIPLQFAYGIRVSSPPLCGIIRIADFSALRF